MPTTAAWRGRCRAKWSSPPPRPQLQHGRQQRRQGQLLRRQMPDDESWEVGSEGVWSERQLLREDRFNVLLLQGSGMLQGWLHALLRP